MFGNPEVQLAMAIHAKSFRESDDSPSRPNRKEMPLKIDDPSLLDGCAMNPTGTPAAGTVTRDATSG